MAVEGPTEQVPEGTHEPPKVCSPRFWQEDSMLPTHMVLELTLKAFSLSEVPAQGKATRLLLTNVKLFIHMPHMPSAQLITQARESWKKFQHK